MKESVKYIANLEGNLEERIKNVTGLTYDSFIERINNKTPRTMIELMINIGCNQKCNGCFYDVGDRVSNFEVAERSIKNLRKKGILVHPYFSEPTVDANCLELYETADCKCLITNGISLDNDSAMVSKIKMAGIKEVIVSLNGSTREEHEFLSGPGSDFEKTKNAISLLAKNDIHVSISSVLYKNNYQSTHEICNLANELGAREIGFIRLLKIGRAKNIAQKNFLNKEDAKEVIKQVSLARSEYDKNELLVKFFPNWSPNFNCKGSYNFLSEIRRDFEVESKRHCAACKSYYAIVIKEENELHPVYPCQFLITEPNLRVGWFDGEEIDIEKNLFDEKTLSENLKGNCSKDNCEYNEICLGGCRSTAFADTGDIYGGQAFCLTKLVEEILTEE